MDKTVVYRDPDTGNWFRGPSNLSDEEIEKRLSSSSANKEIEETTPKGSFGEYTLNALKKGPGQGIRFAGDVMQTIVGAPKGTPQYDYEQQHLKATQRKVDEALGVVPMRAPNKTAELVGGSASSITDPTNWVLGSGVVGRIFGSYLPTLFSRAAVDTTKQLGGGEGAQVAAGLAGGLVGGGANYLVDRSVSRGVLLTQSAMKASQEAKDAGGFSSALKEQANKQISFQAEQHLQNTFKAAMKADPDFATKLAKAQQEAAEMGVDAIPLQTVGNNPVIRSAIANVANKNPVFAAMYAKQYDDALNALDQQRTSLFGDPRQASTTMQKSFENEKVRQASVLENLDEAARQKSSKLAPNYNAANVAERNKNLLEIRETSASISPRSQSLYREMDAKAADQYLSEGSVQKIWTHVRGEQKESPFQRFPEIWNKIQSKFAPVVDPDSNVRQFNPAVYEETRSLKSAISTEYRRLNKNDPEYWTKRAELSKLRQVVDEAISKDFDPEVVKTWKRADSQYAYDFTLRDMSKEVFNEKGILDPSKLERWLKDDNNRKAIQGVRNLDGTSLADMVKKPQEAVARILQHKDQLNSVWTQLHRDRLLDISGMTPNQVVSRMYDDPKFVGKMLNKYGKNQDTLNALRSFMLDDIATSGKPITTLLKDKNKALVYNRVFGPQYSDNVLKIAQMAESLKKNAADVPFDLSRSIQKDIVEEYTNVPLAQIFSKLRNPILSWKQAVVELASKGMTGRAENQFENKLAVTLLDPEALKKFLVAVDSKAPFKDADKPIKDWMQKFVFGPEQSFSRNMTKGAAIGTKEGIMDDESN